MTTVVALAIFIISYALIASERFPRHGVALMGGLALVLAGVFPLPDAMARVDWETIGLIFGMFILVAILADAGFFTWLAGEVAYRLQYQPTAIFLVFPLLSAVLSAFMGSITVMVFLAPLTLRLARLIGIDPIPLIAAEVCAANAGGTATLMGNAPNIIMGTMLGYGFDDFVIHAAPPAIVATLLITGLFYLFNRKMLAVAASNEAARGHLLAGIEEEPAIADSRLLALGLGGMGAAVALLVAGEAIGKALGIAITPATAALAPALLLMVVGGESTRRVIERIDVESLLFFVGLFILVGALEATGAIATLSKWLFAAAAGSHAALLNVLFWGSGFASAVVDNVPMALAMAYVIKGAAGTAAPLGGIMVWALALGLNIGGNMTPVGASPNVIAYAYLERHGCRIGWGRWIKLTVPPTLVAMAAVMAMILVKYRVGWY